MAKRKKKLSSKTATPTPPDEEKYISVPEAAIEPGDTVVVQDFDPANPGGELVEPQKVLKPADRIARKAEQRKNLDKG